MDTKNKIITVVGSVALVGVLGGGVALFFAKDNTPIVGATTGAQTRAQRGQSDTSANAMASTYKDGIYVASSDYFVPSGSNSISATVTIKNGKIAAVNTSDNYSDYTSSYYVDSFKSSVSGEIVGQSLDGLSPSRVGGASLTTYAFDNVLDTIRSKALG